MKIIYHHRTQAEKAEGVHIREVVNALRAIGNDVSVVSPPGVDPFADYAVCVQNQKAKPFIWKIVSRYFPEILFEFLEVCYNVIAYVNVSQAFRCKRPDMFYERYAFFCLAGAYVAARNKIPFIIEVNEISGVKRTRGQVLLGLAKYIEKKIFCKAKAIIVVSSYLKVQIESRGIPGHKIHVVPNGVDVERFSPDRYDSLTVKKELKVEDRIVLGFIGSFVQWHNFNFLFEAVAELVKKEPRVMLLLVGDGPMRRDIENLIVSKKLEMHAKIVGAVEHRRVPALVSAMDIGIIPHSNQFRSPIKMFEYMAMAKPVLAPDVEPVCAVIENGVNGVLFHSENKADFMVALFSLVNDPEKRNVVGVAARKTILSCFLWKNNARAIISIYNAAMVQ